MSLLLLFEYLTLWNGLFNFNMTPSSHHLQNVFFFLSSWWNGSVYELLPTTFCKLSWNYKAEVAAVGKKDGSVGKDSKTGPGTWRFVTDWGLQKGNEEWRPKFVSTARLDQALHSSFKSVKNKVIYCYIDECFISRKPHILILQEKWLDAASIFASWDELSGLSLFHSVGSVFP